MIQIFTLSFVSQSAAQSPDSLDIAIDKLLNRKIRVVSSGEQATVQSDSIAILHYLSEGAKYNSLNYDTSLFYIRKALGLSMHSGSLKLISLSAQDLGEYFIKQERFKDALACYLQCLRIEDKRNDMLREADIYKALGMTYYYMEIFSRSLDYNNKALEIYTAHKDTLGIASVLEQLGSLNSSHEFCETRTVEEKKKDFQIAISYFEKSANLYSLYGNEKGTAEINIDFASVYNKMRRPDLALGYIQKALVYFRKIKDPESTADALYVMGKAYRRLKDYDKSIESFKESEEISNANGLSQGIQFLYEAMATSFNDVMDYKQAYEYYIKYMTIRDSVYNKEKSRQFIELETKYQSELRQNQILKLTSQKRERNNLIYMLTGVIFLLGSFIYYYMRLIRKNKIIAEQKIQISENKILELEKERSYLAARSVLEGEEAERSRLAGDLHNGLGGLLSGIKINLSSMKENSIISNENVSAFNHALSLLDTSISELRRIAHNLMPETLNHYGLKTALEDFCTQVAPEGNPEISVRFFGDEIRYTKELELTMYRIIQELVNNALKHATATTISVQVFSEPRRMVAQVIDNGRGFETSGKINDNKGKGLENIYNRVTAMNGEIDIWSQIGQGTEVSIEIEIP